MSRSVVRTVYSTGYFFSYSVVFPFLWIGSIMPTDNAMGAGVRDGAGQARRSVARLRGKPASADGILKGA